MSVALSETELRLLRGPDEARRRQVVAELLGRGAQTLVTASRELEAVADWNLALPVAEAALRKELAETTRAELAALRAWCLFWANRSQEAWEVLSDARELTERVGDAATKQRAFLVSGYVLDVRGSHARAQAWFEKALAVAPSNARPHVLLEIGTSLSKQGNLAGAIARFDEALAGLNPEDTKHRRLQVHLLSRSAVAHESLGDFAEALKRHRAAYAAAQALQDEELEFSCLCRRARTFIAAGDFAAAEADLHEAEPLAKGARRGPLLFAHDLARLSRARGDMQGALARYRECLGLLPLSREAVQGSSDVLLEILDGLDACLRQTGHHALEAVQSARVDLAKFRERNDIYGGQPVTSDELQKRASESTERARLALRETKGFFSAGYYFDLVTSTARRVDDEETKTLGPVEVELLRFLFAARGHEATAAVLCRHLQQVVKTTFNREQLRKLVERLKEELGVGAGELVRGRRGSPGGGYALLLQDG